MSEDLLELSGLHKRFGTIEALKGVDLKLRAGEFFGLLGPNGAGKSTLMKILSGFTVPDEGTFSLQGRPVAWSDRSARRTLGLVPQEIAVYDSLTPLQNLNILASLHNVPRGERDARVRSLLESVGLWERRKDKVKDFSGGMKRRLNIISALVHDPKILLCDEPTVGVDPQSRNAIFDFLIEKNREGLTVIYTTHYMEEAQRLCPRLAVIDEGRILACGTQAELLGGQLGKGEFILHKGPGEAAVLSLLRAQAEVQEEPTLYRALLGPEARISALYTAVESAELPFDRVELRPPSLETLFLKLTGKHLRD
jgi:ABC-2 type transport system ATP-binding protein